MALGSWPPTLLVALALLTAPAAPALADCDGSGDDTSGEAATPTPPARALAVATPDLAGLSSGGAVRLQGGRLRQIEAGEAADVLAVPWPAGPLPRSFAVAGSRIVAAWATGREAGLAAIGGRARTVARPLGSAEPVAVLALAAGARDAVVLDLSGGGVVVHRSAAGGPLDAGAGLAVERVEAAALGSDGSLALIAREDPSHVRVHRLAPGATAFAHGPRLDAARVLAAGIDRAGTLRAVVRVGRSVRVLTIGAGGGAPRSRVLTARLAQDPVFFGPQAAVQGDRVVVVAPERTRGTGRVLRVLRPGRRAVSIVEGDSELYGDAVVQAVGLSPKGSVAVGFSRRRVRDLLDEAWVTRVGEEADRAGPRVRLGRTDEDNTSTDVAAVAADGRGSMQVQLAFVDTCGDDAGRAFRSVRGRQVRTVRG